MKSKISLFNWTIFLKNLTLFWPIWGGYLLFLLVAQPGFLQLELMSASAQNDVFTNYADRSGEIISYQLTDMNTIMDARFLIVQTAVMAVLTGMALFHYLCAVKSTNMIHALPVTRGELFGTNVISGFAFIVVPQVISFFFLMAVCLGNGISQVEYLGMFVLLEIGMSVLWYGIAVFCAMLTGQMFAVPVFFLVVNLLFVVLRILAEIVVDYYAYGVRNVNSVFRCTGYDILSPLFFLIVKLEIGTSWGADGYINGIRFYNCGYVALYLLAAAVFFAAAYVLYRKRHLENAGDMVSFGFARPLFRWGVGFFSFYIMVLVGMELEELIVDRVRILPALVFGMVCSILAFFISQMVLEKSFRVFKIRYLKECGCMMLFVFCTLFILCGYSYRIQEFVPKADQISDASINLDYEWTVPKEDYDKVCRLHRLLLDYGGKNYKWKDVPYRELQGYVTMSYQLKNGKQIYRYYEVPEEFEGQELIDYFREQLMDADYFLEHLMGEDYREKTSFRKWQYVTLYCDSQAEGMEDIYTGDSVDWLYEAMEETDGTMTSAEVDEIYQAVIADAAAGTLQKYNIHWGYEAIVDYEEMYSERGEAIIHMSWQDPLGEGSNSSNIGNEEYWNSRNVTIYFGKDCENIMEVLKKCIERYGINHISTIDDEYYYESQ